MTRTRALAVLAVFLAACGGGASSDGQPGSPVEPPAGQQGAITITLRPASSGAPSLSGLFDDAAAPLVGAQSLPNPTDIRFVVTNPTTNFKTIQDVTIAGTQTVNIPVPAATGYVLDVVSWASCSALGFACYQAHYILKSGELTGIDVVANAQTSVSLTLQPPVATITPPVTTSEGDPATITVASPAFARNFWYMHNATSAFSGVAASNGNTPYSSGSSIVINAPTPRDGSGNPIPGLWYFQAQFFIADKFTTGSDWTSWVYFYPNPSVGDASVTCALTVPTGGIDIGVIY
jgi:hypothetical protein